MGKLPTTVIQQIYGYDNSYKDIVGKVMIQLNLHCFIYGGSECYKPYNQCVCYCQTCRTFLRFCRQLYFKDGDMTEEDLEQVIPMTR